MRQTDPIRRSVCKIFGIETIKITHFCLLPINKICHFYLLPIYKITIPLQILYPKPSSSHKNYKKKQNKFPILETNYYICTVKLNSKTMKLIKPRFDVIMLQEADDFLASLDTKVRNKIIYNARKSSFVLDN